MNVYLILVLLCVLSSIMAEAALFVYKPKEFKALPYVSLAAMLLLLFGSIFFYGYPPEILLVNRYMFGVWLPEFVYYSRKLFVLTMSLPIVTLLVLLIVKKNQEKKENETAS